MSEKKKRCSVCGVSKSLGNFYAAADHTDGLMSQCKSCVSDAAIQWHQDNPEKARAARSKNYHKDVDRSRALSRARNARWREKLRLEGLAKGLIRNDKKT